MALALAYLAQFLWLALWFKGQSPMGSALETIAHEAFYRQYDGLPQMQVFTADAGAGLCPFWNFEGVWGRCLLVVLHVRDYQPDQLPKVELEVMKLTEQLRHPCVLLSKLRLPNERQLSNSLECGNSKKSFRLRVLVNTVIVDESRQPSRDRPYRWWVSSRDKLNEYFFKGEF